MSIPQTEGGYFKVGGVGGRYNIAVVEWSTFHGCLPTHRFYCKTNRRDLYIYNTIYYTHMVNTTTEGLNHVFLFP